MAAGEALLPIEVPPLSAGAPLPHVFADEDKLLVAYIVNKTDPSFDGTNPRSVSPVTNGQSVAILTAKPCLALQFGLPNDEALSGHRLYKLGLQPYAAFEVLNSSWIGSLEQANRVHSSHQPGLFSGYRHFIFTFHDSTLEFVAESFSMSCRDGSVLTSLMAAISPSVTALPDKRIRLLDRLWRRD
ncbi:hypothetical protein [Mesorhizobium sp. M1348]|uniref:hypothetical protein n=1 Tax=unclassified Mesorhizobium TaxID=325217 RepID=UPI00333C8BEF